MNIFHSPEGEETHHAYETALERKVDQALTPFEQFVQSQVVACSLLLIASLAAIILATLPWTSHYYFRFVQFHLGFNFEQHVFTADIKYWVNDILLTLFFLLIGLEIKREFLVGEFTHAKRASLTIVAAIGSMIVPILIYLLFNYNSAAIKAWAIPLPIGTAFTIGIIALFRKKFPRGLIAFITAVAILDDIVAIILIAFLYSKHLEMIFVVTAAILFLIMLVINFAGMRRPLIYILIGIMLWITTELSGIHGTIVGLLVAIAIPARPKKGPKHVIYRVRQLISKFEIRKRKKPLILEDQKQHAILEKVEQIAINATTPLQRWERALELPVALLILPLFAFTNAGIPIKLNLLNTALTNPISLGIALALIIGKPLGIMSFSYIACKIKIATLPRYTQFSQIFGASLLAGIGFTMSLFIADLSFNDKSLLLAKIGIIFGSLIAGILGWLWLLYLKSSPICKANITEC
ncbi:MAG: Na+/H+ antiporter NhaA [Gammaproteobacteria bacterium]|jgi:NhaA family Na+:H+ antiporter